MQIRYDSTDVTVNAPVFGYSTSINLAIDIEKARTGYVLWDNGSTNDIRKCDVTFLLSVADTNSLIGIFQDSAKGRGENLVLKLGTDSGFHPFGPDKGDSGDFTVRLVDIEAKENLGHPLGYFNTRCTFVSNGTYPSYSPPAQINEGSLQIGTITGLSYPPPMHTARIEYGLTTVVHYASGPTTFDRSSNSDRYVATLPMITNESNAAAVIAHLVGTVRANDVNIIPPANAYLFGRENLSTATYVCKFIQNSIEITHERYDRFIYNLSFFRIS